MDVENLTYNRANHRRTPNANTISSSLTKMMATAGFKVDAEMAG